jgi:hypothetical protein
MQFGQQCKVLALVSVYSPPHAGLFEESNGTVLSCIYLGAANLKVIDISSIVSVVAMIPHDPFPVVAMIPNDPFPAGNGDKQERYFVAEKPGLDATVLGGISDDQEEQDGDEE